MADPQRLRIHWAAIAFAAVLLSACQREEPPPPPPSQAASSPGTAVPGPVSLRAAESNSINRQSSAPPITNAPGAPAFTTPPVARPAPSPIVLAGVDGQDAPNAPRLFPHSNELQNWVKIEPVALHNAAALTRVLSPEAASHLAHFAIRSVAAGAYRRAMDGRADTIRLLAFEAATPDDACGLTSCAPGVTPSEPTGGLTRVEAAETTTFHTWQGRTALRATMDRSSPENVADLCRFVQFVAARIQAEPRPALLEAVALDSMLPGQQYLLRHLASLPPNALHLDPPIDPEGMSRALGLGPTTLMCIANYAVPGARRPNACWIVRYRSADLARQAARRVQRLIASNNSGIWAHTHLHPVKGPYLLGTWTVEEESLSYVLPRIADRLSSQP